jgi:hypothetical protein
METSNKIQKNKFVETPLLSKNSISYASCNFRNLEFQGFIEIPYDGSFSYYCFTEDSDVYPCDLNSNNKMYLAVCKGYYTKDIENDVEQVNYYINDMVKSFNKDTSTNEKMTFEKVKDLLFKNIDINNIENELPYVVFFRGCDDGSWYFRFKSEKEGNDFIQSILNYEENLNNFFYPEFGIFPEYICKFMFN